MTRGRRSLEYRREGLFDNVVDGIKPGPDVWFVELLVGDDLATFVPTFCAGEEDWRHLLAGLLPSGTGPDPRISQAADSRLEDLASEIANPGTTVVRVAQLVELTGIRVQLNAGEPRFTHMRVSWYTHDLLSRTVANLTKNVTTFGLDAIPHRDLPVTTRQVERDPLLAQIDKEVKRREERRRREDPAPVGS
jgi:hypothetical protein